MRHIVTINAGSSSIKFAIFEDQTLHLLAKGIVDNILDNPSLTIHDKNKTLLHKKNGIPKGHTAAIETILKWIQSKNNHFNTLAIGHRIVHGGKEFKEPIIVNHEIIDKLKKMTPLVPLHQPYNIEAIKAAQDINKNVPQIACFDTSFHTSVPKMHRMFNIPRKYAEQGILRYSFHGLSYQYIASIIPQYIKNHNHDKVIVAHLGNGASMCAMQNLKSTSTTMGFSALEGLMMGTRCGTIDPGVILYLIEEKGMSSKEITNMLYNESGIKGISEVSHDIRQVMAENSTKAQEAIEIFCYQAARQLASLIPSINGLEAIIFTAGIGEGSSHIRRRICEKLAWLGVKISTQKNNTNQTEISTPASKIGVYVIKTNEELIIAQSVKQILKSYPTPSIQTALTP